MIARTGRNLLAQASDRLRSSLWLIPGFLIVAAAFGAAATLAVDRRIAPADALPWWAFHAGPEGARATLSAIATSVMTVAGLAFSITIVVLQLASSQFSPRVVRNFMRDRVIQVVLGVYMGTFTYALLALRSISSREMSQPAFSAPTSVTVATALALLCMVLLVVFVHHVANSVQVSTIIDSIAREARGAIAKLYPEDPGRGAQDTPPPLPSGVPLLVRAKASGYLDYVDDAAFAGLPRESVVQLSVQVGDYVRHGDVLASWWRRASGPGASGPGTVCDQIEKAFALGTERTVQQDVRFGLRMIVDIALRAVSPGINDPTTAVYCVNVLGDLLSELATRGRPLRIREHAARQITIHVHQPEFGDLAHLAFDQLLHYARGDSRVVGSIVMALEAIVARTQDPARIEPVRDLAVTITAMAADAPWPDRDRAAILRRLREATHSDRVGA